MRRPPRKSLVLVLLGLLLLTACQVNVDIATKVNEDGSGTITVAVGFDDGALKRLGNPGVKVVTDDLKAVGWEITPPTKEADGMTWLRATRRFANPDEATEILKQFTGGSGPFHDFAVTKETSVARTTWTYKGTVDLTSGLKAFGDAGLAPVLNGDEFGGQIAAAEQEEKKPATQMFSLHLSVELPGGTKQEWRPSFADPSPTQIAADSTVTQPLPVLPASSGGFAVVIVAALGLAVVAGILVMLRNRFRER